MKIQTISIKFSSFSNLAFESIAAHIIACMDENINFLTPIPTITVVKAAKEKYSRHLLASKSRSIIDITERKKSRGELEALLGRLGEYIIFIAEGDVTKLATTGYKFKKLPEPRNIPNPGNVTLTNGVTSGQIKARIKGIKGAIAYAFDITTVMPTENTNWETLNSSSSKFVYKNLVPGKQYWMRVGAIGTKGQVAYSPVASYFAQ